MGTENQPDQPDQPDQTDQPDQPDQTDNASQPEQAGDGWAQAYPPNQSLVPLLIEPVATLSQQQQQQQQD